MGLKIFLLGQPNKNSFSERQPARKNCFPQGKQIATRISHFTMIVKMPRGIGFYFWCDPV